MSTPGGPADGERVAAAPDAPPGVVADPASDPASDPAPVRRTPVLRLVLAWTLVGVPLAWGVYQVFLKSLDLFR